jgi:glutamine amidotransferase
MITIVDYGVGNVASVKNMLTKLGASSEISSNPDTILNSSKVILPGVGAFDAAMARLQDLDLARVVQEFASTGKPLLGICLGAQILLDSSEEGKLDGLGLISGKCLRFSGTNIRVPHMGWSEVKFVKNHALNRFDVEPRFYFVHSYYMSCKDLDDVLGWANYNGEFVSAISRGNVMGVQFHPEKSHRFGMQLLKNFAEL